MKKILCIIFALCSVLFALSYASAVENTFDIIPKTETDVSSDVTEVGKAGGGVWDKLNEKAKKYEENDDIGAQFASGAFTRNTLLNYVIYLVRFLSQIALVIGAGMIVVAGYKYAQGAFTGKASGSEDIKNAIIGVLIVIFSYAIMRILTEAFLT